jgi:hypothetical protein
MNDAIRTALSRGGIIDITTTGRRSGQPRRIEIVFHAIDGRIVISGMPRGEASLTRQRRDRPARDDPPEKDVVADLPGAARVIVDEQERRTLLVDVARNWGRTDLETMVRYSPLIEVVIDDPAPA